MNNNVFNRLLFAWAVFIVICHSCTAIAQTSLEHVRRLISTDWTETRAMGKSVAIYGEIGLAGAPDDIAYSGEGSVYVLGKLENNEWAITTRLSADDAAPKDQFGFAIDIYENTAVIGAVGDDGETGSAYVFERDGDGNWLQTQKLVASDASAEARFGCAVAIDVDTVLIGATGHDEAGADAGVVYVFRKDKFGVWVEVQHFAGSATNGSDYFGFSIDMEGEQAIISTTRASGGVRGYIFEEDSNRVWQEVTPLIADEVGGIVSVALQDSLAVIGLPFTEPARTGSAYVFKEVQPGNWIQVQQLFPYDTDRSQWFGFSVEIAHGEVFVSTPRQNHNAGAIHVFTSDPLSSWIEIQKARPPVNNINLEFGYAIAASDSFMLAGEPFFSSQETVGACSILSFDHTSDVTGLEVIEGTILGGDVTSIQSIDTAQARIKSGLGSTLVDLHNMEILVTAVSEKTHPPHIDLTIGTAIDQPSGSAQVLMRNYRTGQIDQIARYPIGLVRQYKILPDINGSDYIDDAGNLEIHIKHIVFVPFLAFTFESFIEYIGIAAQ